MYVCMCVCIYVCMYVFMYVCMHVSYVCMYVYMYIRMYVFMYVNMYKNMYVSINFSYINKHTSHINKPPKTALSITQTQQKLMFRPQLPEICMYLERRVGKKFARKEYGHLEVAIRILQKLVLACHADLRLFANVVVRITKFLLRQTNVPSLQVCACMCVCMYVCMYVCFCFG